MTTDTDSRVDLGHGRPQGLPFLKPLYGPGPYQFSHGMSLHISYRADRNAVLETLPRQLELDGDGELSMSFWVWPEVTGMGAHSFAMPVIPVRYGDFAGSWVPYLYTSTDASLACYREVQGWPAVMGSVELTEAAGEIRARVLRNGREIMRASATVAGEPFHELGGARPIILYKEIPALDTTTNDVGHFITSTSLLTDISMRAGTGTLEFTDPGDDPVARLAPVEISGAAFGSLNDLYPETIRILGS